MKKNLLLSFFLLLTMTLATSCKAGKNHSDDKKSFTVHTFHAIHMEGGYTVSLSQGNTPAITVEAPDAILEKLLISVDNGVLRVIDSRFERNGQHGDWENLARKIHLHITSPGLEDLKVEGYVGLKTTEPLMSDNLNIHIEGGGHLKMDLVTDKLGINIEGGMVIELAGQVNFLDSYIAGAGKISAYNLKTDRARINIQGAGYALVNVSDQLRVELDGVGWVRYKGNPEVDKNVSGVGFVSKE